MQSSISRIATITFRTRVKLLRLSRRALVFLLSSSSRSSLQKTRTRFRDASTKVARHCKRYSQRCKQIKPNFEFSEVQRYARIPSAFQMIAFPKHDSLNKGPKLYKNSESTISRKVNRLLSKDERSFQSKQIKRHGSALCTDSQIHYTGVQLYWPHTVHYIEVVTSTCRRSYATANRQWHIITRNSPIEPHATNDQLTSSPSQSQC